MQKTVTLFPGQSAEVDFQFTPVKAGVHQVSVDGLRGGFEAISPVTGLKVGGLTVILGCDNSGVCVTEMPATVEQGILWVAETVRRFLAERNYEIRIFPEGWCEYTQRYWPYPNSWAYRDKCYIGDYDSRIVVHEIGHSLDMNLGFAYPGTSHDTPNRQAWYDALQIYDMTYKQGVEHWAWIFEVLTIPGKDTFCSYTPATCYVMRPVILWPWRYI